MQSVTARDSSLNDKIGSQDSWALQRHSTRPPTTWTLVVLVVELPETRQETERERRELQDSKRSRRR